MPKKYDPKYKVDLVSLMRSVYGSKPIEVQRDIRQIISTPAFKRDYISQSITLIVDRTQEGIDKNGKSLGRYSKSYRDSDEFKVFKSGETKVNLTLTSDMLFDIKGRAMGNNIIFDFASDLSATKAFAHITGYKDHPFLQGKVQKRDFFGLPRSEEEKLLKSLVRKYKIDSGIDARDFIRNPAKSLTNPQETKEGGGTEIFIEAE